MSKRDIELVDMTGTVVSMTLWSTEVCVCHYVIHSVSVCCVSGGGV